MILNICNIPLSESEEYDIYYDFFRCMVYLGFNCIIIQISKKYPKFTLNTRVSEWTFDWEFWTNSLIDLLVIFFYIYHHLISLSKIDLLIILDWLITREEEGPPQQFLVRATFSSFSSPSHLGILVHRLLCVFLIWSQHIAYNMDRNWHKIWID